MSDRMRAPRAWALAQIMVLAAAVVVGAATWEEDDAACNSKTSVADDVESQTETLDDGTAATSERVADDGTAATSEPDAAAYRQCGKHYACCQDTMLGDVYDEPNSSRCQTCVNRCNDRDDGRGHWPSFTHAGWDCRYWRQELWYRRPSRECEGLSQ